MFKSNLELALHNSLCLKIVNSSQNTPAFNNWSCYKDIKSKRKICKQSWS